MLTKVVVPVDLASAMRLREGHSAFSNVTLG